MRYVVQTMPESSKSFADHLRADRQGEKLVWDSSARQDVLIVQTDYGCNAVDSIDKICLEMGDMPLPKDRFVEIASLPGVCARYISSTFRTRNGGCPIRKKACTYTVFCCEVENDECIVYRQEIGRAGNLPYRKLRLKLPVQVLKITRTVGLFGRREVDTGYYQILLPKQYADNVDDGDLYYTVASAGDIEIPITKQMFDRETIYVQTYDKPIVASHNDGLSIVQN